MAAVNEGQQVAAGAAAPRPPGRPRSGQVDDAILAAARAELGEGADYLDPIRLTERQAGVEIRG